jgi:hypothetical protein
MTDLHDLRARAVAALAPLSRPLDPTRRRRLVGGFRPHAAELARVLAPGLAPLASAAYAPFWRSHPTFGPPEVGARLRVIAARAEELARGGKRADAFPPGYLTIAPALAAGTVWLAWSYVGADGRGTLFDGLVWTGERLVWLPQPYLFLSPALRARPQEVALHWAD